MTSPTRRPAPRLLLLAAAAWLAGCPAPTGRTRSRIPDADPYSCPGDSRPDPGDPCEAYVDYCTFTQACAGGGFRNVACTCSYQGTWECSFDRCLRDAGFVDAPAGCPTETFWSGYACTSAQVGATCRGNVLDCNGSVTLADCRCDSFEHRWKCDAPSCRDGGARDAAHADAVADHADVAFGDVAEACPAEPADGARCLPGLECAYPGPCPAYCACSSEGVFACDIGACTDAGAEAGADAGTGDAAEDAGGDDAGDDAAGDAGLEDTGPDA